MSSYVDLLRRISVRCAPFLQQRQPLFKNGLSNIGDMGRVKVRFKQPTSMDLVLDQYTAVPAAQRYVRTNTVEGDWYVFPSGDFKLVWAPGDLLEQQPTDVHTELTEGQRFIPTSVYVYGVSDFYAVKRDLCPDYDVLLEAIIASSF